MNHLKVKRIKKKLFVNFVTFLFISGEKNEKKKWFANFVTILFIA